MAAAPQFTPNEIVYLQASAAIGFLEALMVSSISMDVSGRWVYTLATYQKAPTAVQSMGDRITIPKRTLPLQFYEEDLMTYCDALAVCIASVQQQLASLQALQATQCQGQTITSGLV